ncbi:MAG TPA: hypothetical protein V6D03_07440 [Candidatus Caenarcaniphilales bacterium]
MITTGFLLPPRTPIELLVCLQLQRQLAVPGTRFKLMPGELPRQHRVHPLHYQRG